MQGRDSCYRDLVESPRCCAMSFSAERRQQSAKTTAIDHAIDLACTQGLSFASAYLRNQRFCNETIAQVLSDPQGRHRWHDCSGQFAELPYASESPAPSNTTVRQLSYSSRSRLGRLR